MERKADGDNALTRMDSAGLDWRHLFEWQGCLEQSQVICFVTRYKTQLERCFTSQVALNISNTAFNDVLIGHDVSTGADYKPGTGLIEGFCRGGRSGICLSWCGRNDWFCRWRGNGKLDGIRYPIFFDTDHAVNQ